MAGPDDRKDLTKDGEVLLQLRARVDHLEELLRLKDEFMATVSHELRTPITVIMGYAALLREGNGQPTQERVALGQA